MHHPLCQPHMNSWADCLLTVPAERLDIYLHPQEILVVEDSIELSLPGL